MSPRPLLLKDPVSPKTEVWPRVAWCPPRISVISSGFLLPWFLPKPGECSSRREWDGDRREGSHQDADACLGASPGLRLVLLHCPAGLPASPHPQVCAHPPASPVTPSFPRSQMLGSVLRSTACQICSRVILNLPHSVLSLLRLVLFLLLGCIFGPPGSLLPRAGFLWL